MNDIYTKEDIAKQYTTELKAWQKDKIWAVFKSLCVTLSV